MLSLLSKFGSFGNYAVLCHIEIRNKLNKKNMETITVKVKFRIDSKKTKSFKTVIEAPRACELSFPEIIDKVYESNDPEMNKMWGVGYIIGVEQITF